MGEPLTEAEIRADERRKVCREESHNPVETTSFVPARALVFGQGPLCDVAVNDPYVSAKHCRVVNVAQRWYVEDLGSTNGTFVLRQGMPIKVEGPVFLHPGDQIRIGRTTLPWNVPT